MSSLSQVSADGDRQSLRKDEEYTSNYVNNLRQGGDWDINNFKTIVNWLNLASLYIVLLNYSIEYYNTMINIITIWCLIVSTLSSTISLSQFSVTDTDYPLAALLLKIGFSFASIITALLTGFLKVSRCKEKLEEAIQYQNRWMIFATELSSQLQLPVNIRYNATKIIINQKDQFKQLFNTRFIIPEKVRKDVAKLLETDAVRERAFKNMESSKVHEKRAVMHHDEKTLLCSCSTIFCRCLKKYKNHTEDLDYIYDANRLNIYFIFKDLIYNEIRNFEQLMKNSGKITDNQSIKFTMTPSRIILVIVDKNEHKCNKVPPKQRDNCCKDIPIPNNDNAKYECNQNITTNNDHISSDPVSPITASTDDIPINSADNDVKPDVDNDTTIQSAVNGANNDNIDKKNELMKEAIETLQDDVCHISSPFGFPNLTSDRRSSNNYSMLLKTRPLLSNYSIPLATNITSHIPLYSSVLNHSLYNTSNKATYEVKDNNAARIKKVNFAPTIPKDKENVRDDELHDAIYKYSDNNPQKQMILEIEKLQNKEDSMD